MSTRKDSSFAQGMFVTLWPKVDHCHNYVETLLAAQKTLQQTVDQLIADLNEAEKAKGSSLIGYADRLRNFPTRVEQIQKRLEKIDERLSLMKKLRESNVPTVPTFPCQEVGDSRGPIVSIRF
ncbi:unnamed protein product [Peronospora belbahrii]|uniref:Biogenesis of lysosome-related organelles complex 1 subunit 7 n=1 Tax=Peronospora belbahrii TaxID=622444 RepID=A0AAU9L576_9STRA|nr:unnamed protein product [Peronospora belbahrii]